MVTEKQLKTALKRTHKTARKFASLETEYLQKQKKLKAVGKSRGAIKISFINRYNAAKYDYNNNVRKYKALYAKFTKNLSPDQLRV
jgi:hypothetical protein